jgi:hypothetical protein
MQNYTLLYIFFGPKDNFGKISFSNIIFLGPSDNFVGAEGMNYAYPMKESDGKQQRFISAATGFVLAAQLGSKFFDNLPGCLYIISNFVFNKGPKITLIINSNENWFFPAKVIMLPIF